MKIIDLESPGCGASLSIDQITEHSHKIRCSYCGNIFFLQDTIQAIKQENIDKENHIPKPRILPNNFTPKSNLNPNFKDETKQYTAINKARIHFIMYLILLFSTSIPFWIYDNYKKTNT